MNTKHTAGTWKIYDTCLPARGIMEITADGKVIANVKRLVTGKCYAASQCPEAEANAKLIAAAPSLYNASYSALQAIYAMPKKKQAFYQYLINDLLDAIQKADGTRI